MKRLGNGTGSVYKLSGNRRKPWAARKTVGWNDLGHPKYKFIGFYRTRSEAMAALMAFNKTPHSLDGETLQQMYDGFIEGYSASHSEKTVYNFNSAWKHVEPLYDVPVADITRKQLQLFFDSLDVTQQVKEKIKVNIRMVFDYSIRYDVIQPERIAIFDYIDLSSHIPERKVTRKVITSEEIDRMWKMNDDVSRMILFMIYTGLRAGEYCEIAEKGIDSDIIHISHAKTEAGIRDIPLSDNAQKLTDLPYFGDYDHMKYYFTEWRKKNEFDHTLHDTRHTCVSLLANAGVDKRIIQAIVGHKGKDVTDGVYTHIDLEVMREALNKI